MPDHITEPQGEDPEPACKAVSPIPISPGPRIGFHWVRTSIYVDGEAIDGCGPCVIRIGLKNLEISGLDVSYRLLFTIVLQ